MSDAKYQYVQSLAASVKNSPELQKQLREDPQGALERLTAPPLQSDNWIYRIVVISLGLAVLLALISASILAGLGKTVPDGVIAIGSAAAGAMAGLLAPAPLQR